MKRGISIFSCLLLALVCASTAFAKEKDKVETVKLTFKDHQRSYLVMIPHAAAATQPLPVVLLLHAQGGWATDVMGLWHNYASRQGFIVVAPESMSNTMWSGQVDGPDYLHAVLQDVAKKHPIDPTKVYIFGDSTGGNYGIAVALFDSQDWGAVCSIDAIIDTSYYKFFADAQRKVPFQVWVGDSDDDHPLRVMALEHDAFTKAGFPFDLKIIPNNPGAYGNIYDQVNEGCYHFFQAHPLPAPGAAYLASPAPAEAPAPAAAPSK